jgi:hypothetical protein
LTVDHTNGNELTGYTGYSYDELTCLSEKLGDRLHLTLLEWV